MFKTYFLDTITKHFFDFKGRATRKQFWLFTLFNVIFLVILTALGTVSGSVGTLFRTLYYIYSLVLLLPSLGLTVRRLHDINFRGWWVLLAFIPVVGPLTLLVFYILPSKEPNRF